MHQDSYKLYTTEKKQYFAISSSTGGNFQISIMEDEKVQHHQGSHGEINLLPGGTAVIEINLSELFEFDDMYPYYIVIDYTAEQYMSIEYTFSISLLPLKIS